MSVFRCVAALAGILFYASSAPAAFKFHDDGKGLTVLEGGKPVLTYQYAEVTPPGEPAPGKFPRACFIHPVYGLDGDVLTEDCPPDHYHHRGVFWAWPQCALGATPLNTWLGDDTRQVFDSWVAKRAGAKSAELTFANLWKNAALPDPPVRETVQVTVHRADRRGRSIDFRLQFSNLTDQPITFLGADGKGYGGFCFRTDAHRTDPVITVAQGPLKEDALRAETPWADFSSRQTVGGTYSGAAIFQHPGNPGYPHPGWILRYYGLFGPAWPHVEAYSLAPHATFELQYRLYLHRGTAEQGRVAERFRRYTKSIQKQPK